MRNERPCEQLAIEKCFRHHFSTHVESQQTHRIIPSRSINRYLDGRSDLPDVNRWQESLVIAAYRLL